MNFKATKIAVFDEEKTVLMTSPILAGRNKAVFVCTNFSVAQRVHMFSTNKFVF